MTTMMEMEDMGSGDHEDLDWDDKSHMECRECGHGGAAATFHTVAEAEVCEECGYGHYQHGTCGNCGHEVNPEQGDQV